MATLSIRQLNLTKNIHTDCFEVEITRDDWVHYESLQDIFFMDEHSAVASLVLINEEKDVAHLMGEPELAKLDTAA